MKGLVQDIRHGLRQFKNKPGLPVTAVLTLTLGIAANVSIFSAINGAILRPLPMPQAEQIAVLAAQAQGA
ncbi:MAG: hypothetical protein JO356_09600, partial [Acidobacteria bacterium]|nr:hypothetical protein [Acidobacteriota bacterium]